MGQDRPRTTRRVGDIGGILRRSTLLRNRLTIAIRSPARLAALIPRPGKNLVRYHGVLAPNARDRAEIVPAARAAGDDGGEPPKAVVAPVPPEARTGRYLLWHELLRRVFEIDVLACPKCGGRLRLLCTVHDGFSARRYLQDVSAQAPPAEARPPPGPVETTSA